MKVTVEEDRVSLDFARNGANLGRAFDITGWSEGSPVRPLVSLGGRGDRLTITRQDTQHFPQEGEEEVKGISGDWESEDGAYQLSVDGDERMCSLSAKVANTIFCSVKYNEQRGWTLAGGVGSTLMLPPPHLQALEEKVKAILGSLTNISVSTNPHLLLLLTSAEGTHRFHRAARPVPATKENIKWMN